MKILREKEFAIFAKVEEILIQKLFTVVYLNEA